MSDEEPSRRSPQLSQYSQYSVTSVGRYGCAARCVAKGEVLRGADDARDVPGMRLPVRARARILDERGDAQLHDHRRDRRDDGRAAGVLAACRCRHRRTRARARGVAPARVLPAYQGALARPRSRHPPTNDLRASLRLSPYDATQRAVTVRSSTFEVRNDRSVLPPHAPPRLRSGGGERPASPHVRIRQVGRTSSDCETPPQPSALRLLSPSPGSFPRSRRAIRSTPRSSEWWASSMWTGWRTRSFAPFLDNLAASPGAFTAVRFFGALNSGTKERTTPTDERRQQSAASESAGAQVFAPALRRPRSADNARVDPVGPTEFLPGKRFAVAHTATGNARLIGRHSCVRSLMRWWPIHASGRTRSGHGGSRYGMSRISPSSGKGHSTSISISTAPRQTLCGHPATRSGSVAPRWPGCPASDAAAGAPLMRRFLQFLHDAPDLQCDFLSFHEKGTWVNPAQGVAEPILGDLVNAAEGVAHMALNICPERCNGSVDHQQRSRYEGRLRHPL